jgi:acetyltransferase-like isoleucine patch superfamily enzyme
MMKKITPIRALNKIKWMVCKKKLKSVGKNCSMGEGFVLSGSENIVFGDYVVCGNNVKLETWLKYRGKMTGYSPILTIGNDVTIASGTFISCLNRISIGDGVLIGTNAFICDNSHGKNSMAELNISVSQRELWSKGPIVIGKNVWIGRNVCIMPNVHIGAGAVIGANAVVTHDIPNGCIAVGIPARVIKKIEC